MWSCEWLNCICALWDALPTGRAAASDRLPDAGTGIGRRRQSAEGMVQSLHALIASTDFRLLD